MAQHKMQLYKRCIIVSSLLFWRHLVEHHCHLQLHPRNCLGSNNCRWSVFQNMRNLERHSGPLNCRSYQLLVLIIIHDPTQPHQMECLVEGLAISTATLARATTKMAIFLMGVLTRIKKPEGICFAFTLPIPKSSDAISKKNINIYINTHIFT